MAATIIEDEETKKKKTPTSAKKTPTSAKKGKSVYPEVSLNKELQFLYKFEPGVAESSFGIVVAQRAGLNDKVLEIAARKAT